MDDQFASILVGWVLQVRPGYLPHRFDVRLENVVINVDSKLVRWQEMVVVSPESFHWRVRKAGLDQY